MDILITGKKLLKFLIENFEKAQKPSKFIPKIYKEEKGLLQVLIIKNGQSYE